MDTIKRKTFGRAATLGCLYDARSDSILSLSIFNQTLPNELIQSIDTNFSDYKYSFQDSFEEKFNNLNVEAELKLSVLGGLLKLEGSAKYLNEQKSCFKSVKGSLIYNIKTKRECLSLTNDKLKPYVSSNALQIKEATHIIVGIDWGANTVASFEYENHEHSEKKKIEGSLKAHMEKVTFSISGEANVKFDEDAKKMSEGLAIKFYGDFIPQNEDLPNSVEKTIELLKKIPKFIETSNDGKGVPLEIELMPIAVVEKFFSVETKIERLLIEINVEIINRIQRELDEHLEAKQKFNDCKKDVTENSEYFPDSTIIFINEIEQKIKIIETRFRNSLSKLLVSIRSGEKQINEIENLIEEFQKSGWCGKGIQNFLKENKKIFNRTETINNYKLIGIDYLRKSENVEILIQKNKSKEIYIMFYSEELSEQNKDFYKENLDCLIKLVRKNNVSIVNKEILVLIYDYEIHIDASLCPEKKITIKYYKNGIEMDGDFYRSEKIWNDRCVAESETIKYGLKKPEKTIKIVLPCPNWKAKQGCSKSKYEWWCRKCATIIEYDLNCMFFCECGGSIAIDYGFICNDKHHPENQPIIYELAELEDYIPGIGILKTSDQLFNECELIISDILSSYPVICNRPLIQYQFLEKLTIIKPDDSNYSNLSKVYIDFLKLILNNCIITEHKNKIESLIDTLNTCGHLDHLRLNHRLKNLKLLIENFLAPYAIKVEENSNNVILNVYVKTAKLSDLIFSIKQNLSNKSQSLVPGDEIRIFNSDKIYIDVDLDDECYSGVNISLIGFDFVLAPEKTTFSIKTNGLNAISHLTLQAANGENAKSISDNERKCGEDGKNGKDGLDGPPGTHAGNIFIYANNMPDPTKVFLSACGGNGSDGQIGGNGGNGSDGSDGQDALSYTCKTIMGRNIIGDFTDGLTNYFSGVSWSIGKEGCEGGKGGNTGFSGFGGDGGNAGSVIIKSPKIGFMNITKSHGLNGKDGEFEKSIPGLAGKHGRDGVTWVMTADIVRMHQLVESGKDDGNMNFYTCRCYDVSILKKYSGFNSNTEKDRSNDFGFIYRSKARTYGTTSWCYPYSNIGNFQNDYRTKNKYTDNTKNGIQNGLKHSNHVISKNITPINIDVVYCMTKNYLEQFCNAGNKSYQSWNANKISIFLNQMSFEMGKNSSE